MKTNFKIAWVDDNFSDRQMKSAKELLTRSLKRKNGFSLYADDVFAQASSGNFDNILNGLVSVVDSSNSIDLALIDYELSKITDRDGELLRGQDIAKRFRDALPSVDIVFYSGKKKPEELRIVLAQTNVDNVNCLSRDRLAEDAFTVVENVINRAYKISTLRGLILNSVCEMDHMIVEILIEYYANSSAAIRNAFIDKMATYITKGGNNTTRTARKRALIRKPIEDLLTHKKITSGTLFWYLNEIKPSLNLSVTQSSLVDKYQAEILDLRNSAAHAKEVICQTTNQAMLEFNTTQYRRSDIDDICTTIVAHEANIKSILDAMV